jgi:type VI secretion system (T6SS) spike protein VgrG3
MKIPADFGFVSAKYESGGKGVRTVSSGKGDPGGVSYGVHQLASKTGTMAAFLRAPESEPFRQYLHGAPGSEEFSNAYVELANSYPDEFAAAQLAYILRTHFNPVFKLATQLGLMVEDRGVQEALYSISVQHGGAARIVTQAKNIIRHGDKADAQIRALYRARAGYVSALKMLDSTKTSLLKRYHREVNDAVAASQIHEIIAA